MNWLNRVNIAPDLDFGGLEMRKQAFGKDVLMSVIQQARDADLCGALPAGSAFQP